MRITRGGLLKSSDAAGAYRPIRVTTPSPLTKWRKALARCRAGGSDARILCVGDSTTAGLGAGASTVVGNAYAYPHQLAVLLNSYVPAARGLGIPPSTFSGGSTDARWTAGTGWSKGTGVGWGNSGDYTATSPAGSLVYADPAVLADRFDVYYATNSGLGTLGITATGGSTVNQSESSASGVAKVTVSAASAATTNTVTITGTGNVFVLGVEPWLSTAPKVRVGNAGVAGSKTSDWATVAPTTFGAVPSIKAYAPDLTILSLGINDAIAGTVSAATFLANMQTLITAAQVSGDVIVMPPFPSTTVAGGTTTAAEASYATSLLTLGLPYADLHSRFGAPGADVAAGLGFTYDQWHPNALGYADLAQYLAADLMAV